MMNCRARWLAFVVSSFLGFTLQGQPIVGDWLQRETATGIPGRAIASGVWTGKEFIVWGGEGAGVAYSSGGRYSPSSNQWSYIDSGAVLSARSKHTAVWTGSEMIVWGGYTDGNYFNDGARYSPGTGTWSRVALNPSLVGRHDHFAVWTGSEMMIWGGYRQGVFLADGGAYNPVTDQWRSLAVAGAPSARATGVAVWTGNEVIIWGGGNNTVPFVTTGARFDPVQNAWHPMSTSGAPEGRFWTTAVWTGREMIVWGGRNAAGSSVATGGCYNPATDTWQPVSVQNAPAARDRHVAVWTGSRMVVWGGYSTTAGPFARSGGVYDPAADTWSSLDTDAAPQAYLSSTAVWTGRSMLVFGGYNGGYDRNVFSCVIDPLVDGIADSWRQQYFGADFAHDPRVTALADPDTDGAGNYQEFAAGTDPVDAASVGKVPVSVSTYAGSVAGGQDGFRTEATFTGPATLTWDAAGRIWVCEITINGYMIPQNGAHRIRVLDTQGNVSTFAGSPAFGDDDGPLASARFAGPTALVFDTVGNVLVLERSNHRIRKIDAGGMVSTLAGSTAGFQDATGSGAKFNTPMGMCIDRENNLFVADFENRRVRKVTPQGEVTTYAGGVQGYQDGDRSVARFHTPDDITLGPDGTLYVADWAIGCIRTIDTNGVVATFASGLSYIERVFVDAQGNVYASVGADASYRKFKPDGTLEWKIQNPGGFQDGPVTAARFGHFGQTLVMPDGNLLISDGDNNRLRLLRLEVPPLLTISPSGSLFTNFVEISLSTAVTNGVLRYTLDGMEPGPTSPAYAGTFSLHTAATVKAAVFVNNIPVSGVLTQAFARVYALDDGIPAAWRELHFGAGYLTDPRVAWDADPDGDGANNLQEFVAGTDPMNALSGLRVGIRLAPVVTWSSVPNMTYRVLRKETLSAADWVVVAPAVLATNVVSTYVDLEVTSPRGFYVIEVVP